MRIPGNKRRKVMTYFLVENVNVQPNDLETRVIPMGEKADVRLKK